MASPNPFSRLFLPMILASAGFVEAQGAEAGIDGAIPQAVPGTAEGVGLAGFPPQPVEVRLDVQRGRAAYVSGGLEGWLHQGEDSLGLGSAGFLQAAAGARVELSFLGQGTLTAQGPAILEWDEPVPGGGTEWTLVEATSLRLDVWSGRPLLRIPGHWVAELRPCSLYLEGEPDGSIRITHDAGESFLLRIPTPRSVVRPPVEVFAGAKIQVGAGSGFRELVRSPALGASHVRWPLGRADGKAPEGQGDPGTLIADEVRGWTDFPWPWHPDGLPKGTPANRAALESAGATTPGDRWLIGPDGVRVLDPTEPIDTHLEALRDGPRDRPQGPGPWALGLPEDAQGLPGASRLDPEVLGLGHGLGTTQGPATSEESDDPASGVTDDPASPPAPGSMGPGATPAGEGARGSEISPDEQPEGSPAGTSEAPTGAAGEGSASEPEESPTSVPWIPTSPFRGPTLLPGDPEEGDRQESPGKDPGTWVGPRAPGAASRPPEPTREGTNIGSPRRPRFLPNATGRKKLEVGPWGLRWSD